MGCCRWYLVVGLGLGKVGTGLIFLFAWRDIFDILVTEVSASDYIYVCGYRKFVKTHIYCIYSSNDNKVYQRYVVLLLELLLCQC